MNIDRAVAIVFMFISGYFFYQTFALPHDSVVYPRFIIGIMFLMALLLFIQSFMKQAGSGKDIFGHVVWKRFIVVFVMTFSYIVFINLLGFFTSTFMYLGILMFLLRVDLKVISLSVPIFLLILYLVFKTMLNVPLPQGWLI